MGADQAIDALLGIPRLIERGKHRGVIVPQHLQEQRAGELLLGAEHMKEAAVGGTGLGADRGHRRALEARPVEHREPRRQ